MNKPSDVDELKKLAEKINERYPEFGGVEDSMIAVVEQMSDREDMFCKAGDMFKVGSARPVDPSRQRFKAVACKGRNRKRRR